MVVSQLRSEAPYRVGHDDGAHHAGAQVALLAGRDEIRHGERFPVKFVYSLRNTMCESRAGRVIGAALLDDVTSFFQDFVMKAVVWAA